MSREELMEQYKLLKRAKKIEEMGNTERALDLYLELHELYHPNTSDAYERPAILLERKKDYEKALQICLKAVEEIEADRMSGTKDKFLKRIETLQEKLNTQPKKVLSQTRLDYHFNVIGFRSGNTQKKVIAGFFYGFFILLSVVMKSIYPGLLLLGIVYGITYFIDSFKVHKKQKTLVILLMILSFSIVALASFNLPAAINNVIEIQSTDDALIGGQDIFESDTENIPNITSKHIEEAVALIQSEIEVEEAIILVSDDTVTFGLKLQPSTTREKAEALSESFIEILAHRVSQDENIKAPGLNSLGELYDYYSITISAGVDSEDILAKGKKGKTSKYITWID